MDDALDNLDWSVDDDLARQASLLDFEQEMLRRGEALKQMVEAWMPDGWQASTYVWTLISHVAGGFEMDEAAADWIGALVDAGIVDRVIETLDS